MSLPKRKGRVDASVSGRPGKSKTSAAEIPKPLLKIGALPTLSALGKMPAAERAKVKELAARHREITDAHFKAKRAAEAAKQKPPTSKQGHVEDNEDEDEIDEANLDTEDEGVDADEEDEEVGEDEDEDEEDDDEDVVQVGPKYKKTSFEASHFHSRPGRKRDGWFTPRWCQYVTDNLAEARVLGQLAHWFGVSDKTKQCRARIFIDGFLWIYKHYPQLARETVLSEKQVGDAMRNFIKRGIVVAREDADYGRLLRLDPLKIEAIRLSRDMGYEQ